MYSKEEHERDGIEMGNYKQKKIKDSPDDLVSIIITSYNHGKFLPKSILSCLNQTYTHLEILVIDDGSSDDTREIVKGFPTVQYHYQKNSGLSNARNTGSKHAKGKYIVFLDADDWLYPSALEINVQFLSSNENLAFVSGSHFKIFVDTYKMTLYKMNISSNNFIHFLKGNYVGMHATVMYRKDVLNLYNFDESLKTCEDYDLYLKISRMHEVLHHDNLIAAYRLHSQNMSSNLSAMLEGALKVLNRQYSHLTNELEYEAYKQGRKNFIKFYLGVIYWDKFRKSRLKISSDEVRLLYKYDLKLFFRYWMNFFLRR
ncbi:MAG TPA: glycosyltransferase [Anditalea sp.]|nr:glycosyltransferase [Anditalea sp.]